MAAWRYEQMTRGRMMDSATLSKPDAMRTTCVQAM